MFCCFRFILEWSTSKCMPFQFYAYRSHFEHCHYSTSYNALVSDRRKAVSADLIRLITVAAKNVP